jgi:hypothetical protein
MGSYLGVTGTMDTTRKSSLHQDHIMFHVPPSGSECLPKLLRVVGEVAEGDADDLVDKTLVEFDKLKEDWQGCTIKTCPIFIMPDAGTAAKLKEGILTSGYTGKIVEVLNFSEVDFVAQMNKIKSLQSLRDYCVITIP